MNSGAILSFVQQKIKCKAISCSQLKLQLDNGPRQVSSENWTSFLPGLITDTCLHEVETRFVIESCFALILCYHT